MIESQATIADLRFTLPLKTGQSVAVLGLAPALVKALEAEGLRVVMVCPDGCQNRELEKKSGIYCISSEAHILPFGDSSIDHIFIPKVSAGVSGWIPGEVVRILRRGGTVGMGFSNQTNVAGWYSRMRRFGTGSKFLSGSRVGRWLGNYGLRLKASYGVWADLQQPRYLVPLDNGLAVRFFFSNLFVPYTRAATVAQPVASLAARLGARQALFSHLYVVAYAN